jgi:hypothetical protein
MDASVAARLLRMSDESDEQRPMTLSDYAKEPENAKLLTEMLENFRTMAEAGGSRAVIEALSASFAIMADPRDRKHYDALRGELIEYLERLDLPGDGGQEGPRPELVPSPDVSPAQVEGLAAHLLSKASDPDPS